MNAVVILVVEFETEEADAVALRLLVAVEVEFAGDVVLLGVSAVATRLYTLE